MSSPCTYLTFPSKTRLLALSFNHLRHVRHSTPHRHAKRAVSGNHAQSHAEAKTTSPGIINEVPTQLSPSIHHLTCSLCSVSSMARTCRMTTGGRPPAPRAVQEYHSYKDAPNPNPTELYQRLRAAMVATSDCIHWEFVS